MTRLLLDEGVHFKTAALLRDAGFDASHVLEIDLGGYSDEQVLAEAVKREAALVCLDSDFHKILANTQATSPTVIRIRVDLSDPATIADLLTATCESMAVLIEQGAAISVDLGSARGRRLPLN
ncbi:MAG: DUF5615 family PIN-like protein [Phycisphaeraceae bacterium]